MQWGVELRCMIWPIVVGTVLTMGVAFAAQPASSPTGGPTVSAQQDQAEQGKEPPPTPATRAYMDAAIEMHRDMAVPYSGDADKDFAATLEAHHKGAVAIAQVELRYGKDPEMRQLAAAVLEARKREIALLQAWLAKHK
jgi:uncharacterized protein (DUF305 family)